MTGIDLAALGLTQEELQDRVVNAMVERMLRSGGLDDEGEPYTRDSTFKRKLDEAIKAQIDSSIERLTDQHVKPQVAALIEGTVLQQTTKWGEKVGEPKSFIQYLADRADAWLREEVNHQGKTKGEDGYSFRAYGTRVSYMIDKHLAFSIERAMEEAVKNANLSIKEGLLQAVKIALDNISARIKFDIEPKRG